MTEGAARASSLYALASSTRRVPFSVNSTRNSISNPFVDRVVYGIGVAGLSEESWGTYQLSCSLLKELNKHFIEYYRLLTQVRALADTVVSDQPNQSLSSRRGPKKEVRSKACLFYGFSRVE
jgi:hypothetical protein